MPFTLSHPAAVLPLLRSPLSSVALVAGAMAPDMPYFVGSVGIPVSAQSWYEPLLNATTTHSLGGLWVDAVYGLVLCALFWFAYAPLVALVPLTRPTAALVWLLPSLLIGILTHLAWDAVTDEARVVQHVSTAGGLVVLAVFLWRRRVAMPVAPLCVAGSIAAVGALLNIRWGELSDLSTGDVVEGVLSDAAKGAGFALVSALVVYSAVWWLVSRV